MEMRLPVMELLTCARTEGQADLQKHANS